MLTAENLLIDWRILATVFALILVIIALPQLNRLLLRIREIVIFSHIQQVYQKVVEPDRDLLQLFSLLLIADVILLITGHLDTQRDLIDIIELPVGLSAGLVIGWLGYQLLERFFKIYITQITQSRGKVNQITQSGGKVNEDLLILGQWLAFLLFSLIIITIFAQTHEINLLGLIASLGVGGIALAFAAQKILDQLLGGIVLYLDRPFVLDDYIGLPDGTFGKVESIGLRSTKIRTSGKGTLVVVPNNYLTGINIENFTGASKIINIFKLNFSEPIPEAKKAFIRQLISDASRNTEIDPRSITVNFQDIINEERQKITQGQIKFLMLSAGESSKAFRLQLIEILRENIDQKLLDNGISCKLVDRIWIDSQISI